LKWVQDELSQAGQRDHPHERADPAQGRELPESTDRIGVAPVKGSATLQRQRLGQHEEAITPVHQRQAASHEERQMQVDGTKHATHHRAEDEAHAEGRAQHAEALGALLGRGDVGDIGIGHGDIGLHGATDQADGDQHPQRGSHGRDEEAEHQAGEAQQQHRAAAMVIRQRAKDGRGQEVGKAEGEGHRAVPERMIGLVGREGAHQRRQHRDDQADRDHVDQHRHHDEAHAGGFDGTAGNCAIAHWLEFLK